MPAAANAIITGLKSLIFISPESAITLRIDYEQHNEISGERNSFAKKMPESGGTFAARDGGC